MKATKKCQFCGKPFVTRSGMQRYCSEACQAEAKRARTVQKNNLFKVARPLMEIQHQEYLTFSKAATLMGCSRQYVYKLVALGKLKASRISNRMAFIRRADIERMLEGNPYHRILPGNTSSPKKSAPSSLLAKKEKREKEADEVLDFYSGEEVMSLIRSSSRGSIPPPSATAFLSAASPERTITARSILTNFSVCRSI